MPEASPRSPLRLVEVPAPSRSGVGFLLSCAALVVLTMVGLLLLNVAISDNAFTLGELEDRRSELADSRQELEQRLAARSAPGALALEAERLGMVPAETTVVLGPDGVPAGPPVAAEAP